MPRVFLNGTTGWIIWRLNLSKPGRHYLSLSTQSLLVPFSEVLAAFSWFAASTRCNWWWKLPYRIAGSTNPKAGLLRSCQIMLNYEYFKIWQEIVPWISIVELSINNWDCLIDFSTVWVIISTSKTLMVLEYLKVLSQFQLRLFFFRIKIQ